MISINLSNSVDSIGGLAFSGCVNLKSINIPNSVKSIKDDAFSNCSELAFATIGNSVDSIGNYAFFNCSKLTSIYIPNCVKKIGAYAFGLCENLIEVICESSAPTTISYDTFYNIPTIATLYVPVGSKEAYANATGWKNFTNIVEDDEITGLENTLTDNEVSVSVENGNIVINGADNAKVEVYSVNGQCVYSGTATTIPVTAKGLYIVKVGNKSYKVIL